MNDFIIFACLFSLSGCGSTHTPSILTEDTSCTEASCDQHCTIRAGSVECFCYHGYRLHYDRRSCLDINECLEYRNGGCSHYCINFPGGYSCSCNYGYSLASDGTSCYFDGYIHNHHRDPNQQPGSQPSSYPGSQPPTYPGSNYQQHSSSSPYQRPGSQPSSYPSSQPTTYSGSTYQQYPPASHRHTYLGDDPHFAVLLPSGVFLCYSVQGEHDKVFNLISNPDVHINALFIPDAKREEVTWIGSLGIVAHPRHSGRGNRTYISFAADNSSITVTGINGSIYLKSTHTASLSLSDDKMITASNTNLTKQPTVEVTLSDVKLNFTVKFVGSHLDISWQEVGEQPELSHGLIGQFYRQGVEIDEVRKILIIPHKEPVPIMRRPIWSFMERDQKKLDSDFCWTAMNIGYQGDSLIDGHYIDYTVPNILSTNFSPAKVHHRYAEKSP